MPFNDKVTDKKFRKKIVRARDFLLDFEILISRFIFQDGTTFTGTLNRIASGRVDEKIEVKQKKSFLLQFCENRLVKEQSKHLQVY
jgi:hypothetical protein